MVVVKLDRLTRSVGDLAHLNKLFEVNGVALISVQEAVDTSTANGKLFHNIIACLSEWECWLSRNGPGMPFDTNETKGSEPGKYHTVIS